MMTSMSAPDSSSNYDMFTSAPVNTDIQMRRKMKEVFNMLDCDVNGNVSMHELVKLLPWLHRKFPVLARHFQDIKRDSPSSLSFDEFMRLVISKRTGQEMRRGNRQVTQDIVIKDRMLVDATSHKLQRTRSLERRNAIEPTLKCESTGTCADIHHQGHRYEWKLPLIRRLCASTPMQMFVQSRPFHIGGISGFLRFWPNGFPTKFWNKEEHQGWASLNVCFPAGTRVRFRLFVNDYYSEWRNVCFNKCSMTPTSIWDVPGQVPKIATCGVEVTNNACINGGLRHRNLWRGNYQDLSESAQIDMRSWEPLASWKSCPFEKWVARSESTPNL
eukprot:GEMP01035730.1.p1 GENE.GEMP01035730.1~~GEMP01035730.1.p1  ORF type:complete len:330 (+),score=41.23 GEMP01035730.1:154-1143(+)